MIQTAPRAQRWFLFLNAFCKFHRDQFWHLKVTYLLKSYLLTKSLITIKIFKCSFALKKSSTLTVGVLIYPSERVKPRNLLGLIWFMLQNYKQQWVKSDGNSVSFYFFDITIQDEHQSLLRLSCFYITLMKTLYMSKQLWLTKIDPILWKPVLLLCDATNMKLQSKTFPTGKKSVLILGYNFKNPFHLQVVS